MGGLFVRTLGLTVPHPFCAASVVDSSRGDLLITAAHCLGKVFLVGVVRQPTGSLAMTVAPQLGRRQA